MRGEIGRHAGFGLSPWHQPRRSLRRALPAHIVLSTYRVLIRGSPIAYLRHARLAKDREACLCHCRRKQFCEDEDDGFIAKGSAHPGLFRGQSCRDAENRNRDKYFVNKTAALDQTSQQAGPIKKIASRPAPGIDGDRPLRAISTSKLFIFRGNVQN